MAVPSNGQRPVTGLLANSPPLPTEQQRRRTIGAVENVVLLPPRGLKPRPNPSYADLAPLLLPANVQPKKLLSILSSRKQRGREDLLACSVPAPDVCYKVALNRHLNEFVRLEDIQETILEAASRVDEESEGSNLSDSEEEVKPTGWGEEHEVVTRDDTNLARDFSTTYRFNDEVAVAVSETKTEPGGTLTKRFDGIRPFPFSGSTESTGSNSDADESRRRCDEVGSWTSQWGHEVGPISFKASPILSCALEQTRTYLAQPCPDSESGINLPEALVDFEMRQAELRGLDDMAPNGLDDLGLCIGNVTLDDV